MIAREYGSSSCISVRFPSEAVFSLADGGVSCDGTVPEEMTY